MLQRLNRRERRILMTVDAVGGVWQYALTLAGELSRRGDDVVLAGLGPRPSEAQRREAEAFATLAWLDTPPEWMAAREDDVEGLTGELENMVHIHAPDVVHLNAPSQAASLALSCPVVAVSHSCVATWFHAVHGGSVPRELEWQQRRNRRGFDAADIVVAPSVSHARGLAACYGDFARIEVVHNAVLPSALGRGKRGRHALAAARWWDAGKNAATLDAAAAQAECPVFVAGSDDGPNGAGIRFGHAVPLGCLSHGELRELMATCGIFVSPSIYEPFGLAALEAASAGAPLVLADIATYRELWDDAAVFFPPRDADTLARTLNDLAADPLRRGRLGRAAQLRSRQFTVERQADAMDMIYHRAARAIVGE